MIQKILPLMIVPDVRDFYGMAFIYTVIRVLWIWPFGLKDWTILIRLNKLTYEILYIWLFVIILNLCFDLCSKYGIAWPTFRIERFGGSWYTQTQWIIYVDNERKAHRRNGPAWVYKKDGVIEHAEWSYLGFKHRFDGPAFPTREPTHYLFGRYVDPSVFEQKTQGKTPVEIAVLCYREIAGDYECVPTRRRIREWLQMEGHSQVIKNIEVGELIT